MAENSLFSLIHSLTGHEKRYFRLHSTRHTSDQDSHLQRLFDLLESQTTYDEAATKARLAGDPLGKQYAVYKNLLYHAVLRSLQSYRYEHSPAMKTRSGIGKVEILIEKGQHRAALKMLLRTRKQAEEHAQTGYLQELLNLERRLLRHLDPLGYLDELPRIEAYERKLALILEQEAEALRIYDRMFAWVQVERRMEKSAFAPQLAAMGERLLALRQNAFPAFNTTAILGHALAIYRQLTGDYAGMMEAYAELLRLWDEHPAIKSANPQRHARLQIAWLNSTLAAGKVAQHLPDIRALRRIPIRRMAERARIVFQSWNLELLWLMDQKDVAAAIDFLPSFEEKLPELRPYLDELRLGSFFFNAALLHFQSRDFARALGYANRLQPLEGQHSHTLLFRSAFLIGLICRCETGDFTTAESQLRSIKRRLGRQDRDWEFGRVVADWIKRLLPKWGLPEHEGLKKEFHAELADMKEKLLPVPFMLDYIMGWAGQ